METTSEAAPVKYGNHTQWKEKRKAWLQKNQPMWDGIDCGSRALQDHKKELSDIAHLMQGEGLYSPNTVLSDIRSGIQRMIRELRQESNA